MSPLVEDVNKADNEHGNLISNGMTIVNSFLDTPYHFPHTLTLFQPNGNGKDNENLACIEYKSGRTPFMEWCEKYDRKTVVSFASEYGGNISTLTSMGAGSYEIVLATYAPNGLVFYRGDKKVGEISFSSDTLRKIRDEQDLNNKYYAFVEEDGDGNEIKVMKYVMDNSIWDSDTELSRVGFDFNLFDNFISG